MRVPLAPTGGPSAVAPPWTLILSCGMPTSFIANIATQASVNGLALDALIELECQPYAGSK